jgi:hypothetical protein
MFWIGSASTLEESKSFPVSEKEAVSGLPPELPKT